MALVSLQNISIAFGGPLVLDKINLQIEQKQRICLLGRNGSGKSTLMKIIAGTLKPDVGTRHTDTDLVISYFFQDIPINLDGTVLDVILSKMGNKGHLISQMMKPDSINENSLAIHEQIAELNAWGIIGDIEKITTRLGLNHDSIYKNLSGGQKRKVLLAASLACKPNLLILDEPTNHLDIDTITWLEDSLLKLNCTTLFVTHDRALLKRLATRIIELDRGNLYDWSCDYETFISRKQELLESEQKDWNRFDKKLALEEAWLKKGIRARRTRNEGRVKALEKMRYERHQRRELEKNASMNISKADRSGKLVIEANDISFSYDSKLIVNNFSTFIRRGDKTGIVGPNGCGKTTLIKLLLEEIPVSEGNIRHGTNLSIRYFDQLREQLDNTKNIIENVSPSGSSVVIDGKEKHIVSYLQDFLFSPERQKAPITHLSGGERNRLLLAKLFTNPGNLLVFDEPTNDLDIETLELLENLLVEFKGTILLVSHDRTFLNNVVTNTLVFQPDGTIKDCVGVEEYAQQNFNHKQISEKKPKTKRTPKSKVKTKLSYNEAKELKELPAIIEKVESDIATLHEKMSDPKFYTANKNVAESKNELLALEKALSEYYARWEELEELSEKYNSQG